MRQKLLIDIGGKLTYKYYENSIQIKPTVAYITIYDNGGAEKVERVVVTSINTDGTMNYTVLAAVASDVNYNWKATFEFVVAGVTIYRSILLDIVRQELTNPVINADIIKYSFVKTKNYRKVFTADSGSATTIISTELIEDDDYWTAGRAEVVAGVNVGQIRKVTDFVASTNTLTVEAFIAVIDSTSEIVLIRSFEIEIIQAFDQFKLDMKNRGIFVDRIIDNDQIKQYVILYTLYLICLGFSTETADIWFEKASEYKKDYKKLVTVAVFDYDEDDDGNVESDEGKDTMTQIKGER